jgi:uncharacterized coiled-coil DUF342 family protein
MRSLAMHSRRLGLIVVVSVVAVLVVARLSPSARAQTPPASPPPLAAASAVLVVDPLPADAAPESEAAFQRRLGTHVATLRSEQIFRRLMSQPGSDTRKTRWFTGADDPLERSVWLRDHLRVAAVPGTALIEVSLDDVRDPIERATILREICSTYLDGARQGRTEQLLDRTQVLNNAKIKTDSRLKDLLAEMRERQIKVNTDGGGIGRIGAKELELSKLVAEQVDAQIAYGKAYAAFETLKAAVQAGQAPPTATATPEDERLAALVRRLDDVEIRLEVAQARPADKDKGPDPAVADLRVETTSLQKKIQALRDEAAARTKVAAIEGAQQRMHQAATTLEALTKRVDFLKADLGELSNSMVAYANLQQEEKGLREQLRTVKEQIAQTMAAQASTAAAGIRWHQMPDPIGRP